MHRVARAPQYYEYSVAWRHTLMMALRDCFVLKYGAVITHSDKGLAVMRHPECGRRRSVPLGVAHTLTVLHTDRPRAPRGSAHVCAEQAGLRGKKHTQKVTACNVAMAVLF